MTPILLDNTTVKGFLKDAISCEVTEELNGIYELELTYPILSDLFGEIKVGRIIKAKPNDTSDIQQFTIYEITKPINGIITVNAQHISYALSKYPIANIEVLESTPQAIVSYILNRANDNLQTPHGFTAWSNITTTNTFRYNIGSVRSALGGSDGSLLTVFRNIEYEFDNKTIKLHNGRGTDNGIIVAYGKNLTDVTLKISDADSYTAIYPYLVYNDKTYTVDEPIQVTNNSNISERVLVRDFSQDIELEENETEENIKWLLSVQGVYYLGRNNINELKVNCEVSFLHLWQSPEYESFTALEKVSLGDTVTVYHKDLDIHVKTKVIKTVYDSLNEQYIKIELGNAKSNMSATLSKTFDEVERVKKETQKTSNIATAYFNAIEKSTDAIAGNEGGFVVLNPPINPQEILIGENSTFNSGLWRWNYEGLGFSENGYDGPYRTAITKDGRIIANEIYAMSTTSVVLNTGIIQTLDGESYWNLSGNDFYCGWSDYATRITGGSIRQYNKGDNLEVGGMKAVTSDNKWFQAVYYTENANGGLAFDRINTSTRAITKALDLTVVKGSFAGYIETGTGQTAYFDAIKHTRQGTGIIKLGCGVLAGNPTVALEVHNFSQDILARLDIYHSDKPGFINLIGSRLGVSTGLLEIGNKLIFSGDIESRSNMGVGNDLSVENRIVAYGDIHGEDIYGAIIYSNGVDVTSTENIKTNITETDNQSVIDLFKQSKIYKYRYKTPAEIENEKIGESEKDILNGSLNGGEVIEDTTANCMGFVIGRETPNEVISSDGEHIDLYTMASVNWKATQEILTRIEALEGKQ